MDANAPLLELFRAHGVDGYLKDDWIHLAGGMLASARIFDQTQNPSMVSIQLDVAFQFAAGQVMVESCGGFGDSMESAVADGFHNFSNNAFHVLLAVFFKPGDDRVVRETWRIADVAFQVTHGNVGVRGKPPVCGAELVAWFAEFQKKVQAKRLAAGMHWIRVFYAQAQRRPLSVEVLLDNETWNEMQTEMAKVAWPMGDDYYSVRSFLILRSEEAAEDADPTTPEGAVDCLARIVARTPGQSEDDIYEAMAQAGIPTRLADRAYKFTQIAWGHLVLQKLNLSFHPDYLCFDAQGAVIEQGRLEDEACYRAACALAPRYAGTPGFIQLAVTSADVNCVNNALHAGSKPEDLRLGQSGLFMEAPTQAGMANAQKVLEASTREFGGAARPVRPWWKFWK